MQRLRPAWGPRLAFTAFAAAFVLLPIGPIAAAQAYPISLDDLLLRLEENLKYYDNHLPAFFCDEHAVSKMKVGREWNVHFQTWTPGPPDQSTTTDSTFRVKRIPNPDNTESLVESRDIKTLDGHPAQGEELTGPALLSGAFSGGPAIISQRQAACVQYALQPIHLEQPRAPYIVEFVTVPPGQRPANCVLQEDGTGRGFIDSDTMQITRVEFTAPAHLIVPAGKDAKGHPTPPVTGVWNVTVDYTSVAFSGQTFQVPSTIIGTLTANRTVWTFEAHYSNFHKLEVTSRILSADDPDEPAVPPQ